MNEIDLKMIVEKDANTFWCTVNYNNNLIIDEADTIDQLQTQMKNLLFDFENIDPNKISFTYDCI